MNIKPFAVEEWMNEYETGARYNIAETCVDSVSLDELFALTGESKDEFLSSYSYLNEDDYYATYNTIMEMLKERHPYMEMEEI